MTNPLLFPADFPNISTQSELEAAIIRLRSESVNTARKQSHTRRISGQQAIENQNRMIMAIPDLMPLDQIGAQNPPAVPLPSVTTTNGTTRMLGTVGVFSGVSGLNNTRSRPMHELLFGNESMTRLGTYLTAVRNYLATVGNDGRGFFCGGTNDSRIIDTYRYERKTIRRSAVSLIVSRFAASSGISNAFKGVMVGGSSTRLNATRDLQRVVFQTPIAVSRIATFLPSGRFSPHGAMVSRTNGYVYSGTGTGHSGAPLTTIEEVNYPANPETVATLGVTIVNNFHVVHAAFSNPDVGFVAAGSNANPITSNWVSNMITRFPFNTRIPSVLATTLANAKTCADGTGNNLFGYTVGGNIANPRLTAVNTVDRLTYNPTPEQNRRIGARLTGNYSDQGSVSDYGTGFSQ